MTDTLYTKLDNGLTVILKRMSHAPVASFWVWYRVGSRNERTGETGISHFVEHMLFKGTPNFPGHSLKRLVQREGGFYNGITSLDSTRYFETLPIEHLDLALRIESDRMRRALITPEDVQSERSVIISEREGHENSSAWRLGEEVHALAFRVHPYHHSVIGDKVDLQTLTRDQLVQHYQTYYTPNNAIIAAAGDFEPATLLDQVKAAFGAIPVGPPPPPVTRAEPPQHGQRRVHTLGPDPTEYVYLAYRAPSVTHADFIPLVMLNLILSGGAAQHRSSRLYRALVETKLAVSVSSSYSASVDPFLFTFFATVREDEAIADVEAALGREVERIQGDGVADWELAKAIKQMRAQLAYATETVSGVAARLGAAELYGDYRLYDTLLERLQGVTATDVQRVAQTYFSRKALVAGWYTPEKA